MADNAEARIAKLEQLLKDLFDISLSLGQSIVSLRRAVRRLNFNDDVEIRDIIDESSAYTDELLKAMEKFVEDRQK